MLKHFLVYSEEKAKRGSLSFKQHPVRTVRDGTEQPLASPPKSNLISTEGKESKQ